jgi:tetratricopeptide (TPR) repeat protein
LGLGLARIREGELAAGREQIEIAASLDPLNSLVRSYLGKAYYEETRDGLAGSQFDIAKALDPKDPTPWFYDAIRKQGDNRPVEALQDLEKSIELNDNRAVYRSRLLLDEDRAARGASLARIYDDLGFDRLAVLEASESLAQDPANYSAHRFLSDTYARFERHEIARVSELLQAQLLQPVNVNPVQPHVLFTDLGIAGGSLRPTFNEFTRLLEREGSRVTFGGVAGNNGTLADELIVSGVNGRFSYSLGQFHYQSDGFRVNNDFEHDIYNVFAQYTLTPELSVQGEFRRRSTDQGDLKLRGELSEPDSLTRYALDQQVTRLGLHWSPQAQFDTLVSVVDFDARKSDIFPPPFPSDRSITNGHQVELQQILRGKGFNITMGGGRYQSEVDETFRGEPSSFQRDRTNLYAYSNVQAPRGLIWTIGISRDLYTTDKFIKLHRNNIKLGLRWQIHDDIWVRLAAFETLKPALFAQQTIEPTQIAGFNQLYDDFNGTVAKTYAIGGDAFANSKARVGFELHERKLRIPVEAKFGVDFEAESERLFRLYYSWAFRKNWSVAVEYLDERIKANGRTLTPLTLDTRSVPVRVRYFATSGFFGGMTATNVLQKVKSSIDPPVSWSESFTLIGGVFGYRLPDRNGEISIEARNITSKKFRFFDNNARSPEVSNPRFVPVATYLIRASLVF